MRAIPGEGKWDKIGTPYDELKALKRMLFVDAADSDAMLSAWKDRDGKPLALWSLWHYFFSLGPAELRSPYDEEGMTPRKYSAWMDTVESGEKESPVGLPLLQLGSHGRTSPKGKRLEAAVWQKVASGLDSYVARTNALAKDNVTSTDPLMILADVYSAFFFFREHPDFCS